MHELHEYAWNIKKIETDERLKEPIYTITLLIFMSIYIFKKIFSYWEVFHVNK